MPHFPLGRACLLALFLATAACRTEPVVDTANATKSLENGEESAARSVSLRISTASGARHDFAVELAIDEQSQERGLMERASLPPDHGMLFPFPYPRIASFWMKNTPLPLDLIFIRPDGTIAAALPGKPNDLHPISAGEPVSAVLEISGGRAAALGIKVGDRVQWGDCAGVPPAAGAWRADRFCPDQAR
ncbi:MAG: DUF192 domain-containing protein [Sphingomonas sp.]|nr:DUF192 domain-containing protein [Sphingomonas sp.]